MMGGKLEIATVAEAYLAVLKARGIDWLFANAGTDFAPIIEALVRGAKAGLAMPEPVVVPHENAAVGMAHGYYLVTGRPQAVMVHVNVGMANALMGLLNAARDNVPIFFTSGRTPPTESGRLGSRDLPIHWGQEMWPSRAARCTSVCPVRRSRSRSRILPSATRRGRSPRRRPRRRQTRSSGRPQSWKGPNAR
jgi:Thiamine pyrophosphate enzyme, N-terminal TPP binding domain